jgi:GrpB-like predicted nucleotidyltransferase (UPF0157 family)
MKVRNVQRVLVVPYDPAWPALFARESPAVARALGDVLLAIHHMGSTAIPGIDAKPVIDMLAVVSSISGVDGRSTAMEALGYEVMGEFGIPGRRYFRKDDAAGKRTHQVHAFQAGSPHIERHLAFRDFLRAHGAYAEEHAVLKCRLAKLHPNDIAAYTDGKDAFIKEVDAKAAAWRASLAPEQAHHSLS